MPIAGPVFTEWYWTPIFFAIVYGPPIAAVAGGLYLALRRTRWPRAARAALALASPRRSCWAAWPRCATVKHRRAEAADARSVTFATFAAPGLHQTRADVFPDYAAKLHLEYEREGGELSLTQVASDADDVTPPRCELHDGTPFHAWYGPCRSARTPEGRLVAVMEMQTGVPSIAQVRSGTLIVAAAHAPADEADLLALADALRTVDVDDIDWER